MKQAIAFTDEGVVVVEVCCAKLGIESESAGGLVGEVGHVLVAVVYIGQGAEAAHFDRRFEIAQPQRDTDFDISYDVQINSGFTAWSVDLLSLCG